MTQAAFKRTFPKSKHLMSFAVVLFAIALAGGAGAASVQKSAAQDVAAAVERTAAFTEVSTSLYEEVQKAVEERGYASTSEVSGILRPEGGELMVLSPISSSMGTSEASTDGVPMVVTTLPITASTVATYEEAIVQGTAEEFIVSYSYISSPQGLWPFENRMSLTQEILVNGETVRNSLTALPRLNEVL